MDREQITNEWKPVLIPGFIRLAKPDEMTPQHVLEVVVVDGKYVDIVPSPAPGGIPAKLTDKLTVYHGSFLCEAYKSFLADVSHASEQRAIAHLKMIVTEDVKGLPAEARRQP